MIARDRQPREHYWDLIRALLMLLGIPYHVALCYRAGREWIVRTDQGAETFTYIAELIHLFRMPAFFVVAGYFAARMLSNRDPGEWLRGRVGRLGAPFLTCIVTLVPLLNLACELSNLPWVDALHSWRHNAATSGGYWVRHLWFIVVLLYCSTAAAALTSYYPPLRTAVLSPRADCWIANQLPVALLAVAIVVGVWEAGAVEAFYKLGLATNVLQQILRLDELIASAPFFLMGCFLARAPHTLGQLCRLSLPVAVMAALSIALGLRFLDDMSPPVGRFVATLAAVSTTQVIIALAKLYADRPHPFVGRLVAASFTIYLVHMPIIVVLATLGQHVMLPVAVKAPMIMLLALILSYGAWEAIRQSPWLSFLLAGAAMPRGLMPRASPA